MIDYKNYPERSDEEDNLESMLSGKNLAINIVYAIIAWASLYMIYVLVFNL